MRLRQYYVIGILSLGSLVSIGLLTSCSTMHEIQTEAKDQPAAIPPNQPVSTPSHQDTQHEGGIVGTGNEADCKHRSNKDACNDNVK